MVDTGDESRTRISPYDAPVLSVVALLRVVLGNTTFAQLIDACLCPIPILLGSNVAETQLLQLHFRISQHVLQRSVGCHEAPRGIGQPYANCRILVHRTPSQLRLLSCLLGALGFRYVPTDRGQGDAAAGCRVVDKEYPLLHRDRVSGFKVAETDFAVPMPVPGHSRQCLLGELLAVRLDHKFKDVRADASLEAQQFSALRVNELDITSKRGNAYEIGTGFHQRGKFAAIVLGPLAFDRRRSVSGEKVGQAQIMFGWPMRTAKMSRDDAQWLIAAITERCGLHGAKSRGGRGCAVRGKARVSFDIFDDNARLALQGHAAG